MTLTRTTNLCYYRKRRSVREQTLWLLLCLLLAYATFSLSATVPNQQPKRNERYYASDYSDYNADEQARIMKTRATNITNTTKCNVTQTSQKKTNPATFELMPSSCNQTMGPNNKKKGSKNVTQYLEKIMNDLDEIKGSSQECTGQKQEGAPCPIDGSWVSRMGVQLEFTVNSTGFLKTELKECTPPVPKKGFLTTNWTLSGYVPFAHSSLLILSGYNKHDKRITTFVGECRICGGSEMITGQWLLNRGAENCRDLYACIEMKGDIFRRETLKKMMKERMHDLGHHS